MTPIQEQTPGPFSREHAQALAALTDAWERCNLRVSTHGKEFSSGIGSQTWIWVDTKSAWPRELGLKASYSKSPVSFSVTRLEVAPDAYLTLPPALRVVDGLLTLALKVDSSCSVADVSSAGSSYTYPLEGQGGTARPAYHARWARQGRGFSVVIETGWIFWAPGRGWMHSKRKPAIAARLAARREVLPRETWVSLPEALEINPRVTLRAARRAGNCLPGCQDWAERHLHGSLKGLPAKVLHSIATAANDRVALVEAAICYAATELKIKRAAKGRAA